MPDLPSQVSPADHRPFTETAELDRFPLSLHQDLLRGMDHGDGSGPFGPRYTIVGGWRIQGELDLVILRSALFDVVERHEALRSSIVLAEQPYHRLLRPSQPDLQIRELSAPAGDRDSVAEQFLNDVEAGPFGLDEQPLIRAVLGRFDSHDHVLVLIAHHTAVDGWSIHRVLHDLATFYTANREHRMPDLPPARQYREYVAWQQANLDSPEIRAAREFWRQELASGQLVGLPIDHRRSGEPFVTGWHRFILG
ncbi:MAG: condensation domain-containing protein, partial [Jatrophihabitantaceae bacterium]